MCDLSAASLRQKHPQEGQVSAQAVVLDDWWERRKVGRELPILIVPLAICFQPVVLWNLPL